MGSENSFCSDAIAIATTLCERFEGVYLNPYLCPAGVPTIGVGSTDYEDGSKVSLSDLPITAERARQLLAFKLRTRYLPGVMRLCPAIATPQRAGALTDLAYNIGLGNFKNSTLRRKVNAGDWDAVPAELRKWTRGGGRVLRGLVLRREAEIALI